MTVANTLGETENGFDLIVAADILVYFGSLEALLKTFASISLYKALYLCFLVKRQLMIRPLWVGFCFQVVDLPTPKSMQ